MCVCLCARASSSSGSGLQSAASDISSRTCNRGILCTSELPGTRLRLCLLVKSIGGPKLLYALQKSHGLLPVSHLNKKRPVPRLLPSVGVLATADVEANITSLLDPDITPPPLLPGREVPGNIIMFDGIALESKCHYDSNHCIMQGALIE